MAVADLSSQLQRIPGHKRRLSPNDTPNCGNHVIGRSDEIIQHAQVSSSANVPLKAGRRADLHPLAVI
jgi:hypothetical protein